MPEAVGPQNECRSLPLHSLGLSPFGRFDDNLLNASSLRLRWGGPQSLAAAMLGTTHNRPMHPESNGQKARHDGADDFFMVESTMARSRRRRVLRCKCKLSVCQTGLLLKV